MCRRHRSCEGQQVGIPPEVCAYAVCESVWDIGITDHGQEETECEEGRKDVSSELGFVSCEFGSDEGCNEAADKAG